MRRPILACAAVLIYAASLAAPANVGASYLTPLQAQAFATGGADRSRAHARYLGRLAAEEKANHTAANAMVTIAVAVGAACEGSCARVR
ncbi:MAG: hypothetical protein AAF221_14010 [Pseudomonadota bacterium]